MKIRRKLLLSFLLIVALFIAAGAAITYNTMKMAELENNVKTQLQINNNAYAYQQGLDQKQFGTLMYSSDNTAEGERIIVSSAETMDPAATYLLDALANDPTLLSKFNATVNLDQTTINNAIAQVYTIYSGNASDKYVQIWSQLTTLMNAVTQADLQLADVRSATLANVQDATNSAQNYANMSLIIAVASIAGIGAVSVALGIHYGQPHHCSS